MIHIRTASLFTVHSLVQLLAHAMSLLFDAIFHTATFLADVCFSSGSAAAAGCHML